MLPHATLPFVQGRPLIRLWARQRYPPPPSQTVPPASDNPNYPVYPPGVPGPAQPIRGALGAAILGPQNIPVQQQNPDILAPPSTDNGDVCVLPLSNFSVYLFYPCSSDRMQSGPLH